MALNYNFGLSPQAQASLNYSRFSPTGGATAFNLGSGENLSSLSELINSINRSGQSAALGARIPGGPALEQESSANIGSELQGQLPADVLANLRQAAAERGVATGSPASPNSNAAYLRALGLTSLDLTRQGQAELTAAEGRNPAAPIFDPTSQLITPYQAGTLSLEEQRLQNELMLGRQRLAQQSALSGRPAGGQPEADPGAYARQPFASDLMGEQVFNSPYAGTTTGAVDPTAAWLRSINYNPAIAGTTQGPGSTYSSADAQAEYDFWNQFGPIGGGGDMISTDQSGGPEGQ